MRPRTLCTLCLGFLLATIAGCGRSSSDRVAVPDRLTLYSIDGRDLPPAGSPAGGELFYGFPVLGKAVVEDLGRRKALIAAFNDGIARGDGTQAKCFWPRHGLRVETRGVIVDYVICFECLQYDTHRGVEHLRKAIDRAPLGAFNEELKRAGIPLAPSSFARGE